MKIKVFVKLGLKSITKCIITHLKCELRIHRFPVRDVKPLGSHIISQTSLLDILSVVHSVDDKPKDDNIVVKIC